MTAPALAPGRRRTPPWRDVRVIRVAFQVVFLVVVAALIYYLYDNLLTNMQRLGISRTFGFVDETAGYDIAGSDFNPSESYFAAFLVGVRNTAAVAVVGIVLATVLGIIVGIARLSSNWLVRRAAAVYVEAFRNVPVLILIIFWYLAVVLRLPPIGEAREWGGLFILSNRGIVIPWLDRTGDMAVFLAIFVLGLLAASILAVWRTRRFHQTGQPHHRVLWFGGVVLAAGVVAFLAGGQPLELSLPERGDLGTRNGFRFMPEYAALLIGLVVYTASHIAEIVRGSILAVPKGQTEAANALALSGAQRLQYVVLPQAFRVMIPPLANQYLNLTKNSSLGVAIAFPEVARIIFLSISQRAPAPQAIAILMLIYLFFSLSISLVTNLVNWRLRLRGGR